MFDHLNSRSDEQVIRISENDLCVKLFEFARTHCLHRALRSDRHERRRFDRTVRGQESPVTRFGLPILPQKLERFLHQEERFRDFREITISAQNILCGARFSPL